MTRERLALNSRFTPKELVKNNKVVSLCHGGGVEGERVGGEIGEDSG